MRHFRAVRGLSRRGAPAVLLSLVTPGVAGAQGTISSLGVLPGTTVSGAKGISADGSVVVGWCYDGQITRAFRWTRGTGMADLGALPGADSAAAEDVSADGSVIVGNSGGTAFRWTSAGMERLGMLPLPGADGSVATGVSADGSTIVGWTRTYKNGPGAFRWTRAGGMEQLGGQRAWAWGVSGDGAAAVGTTWGDHNAVRWTANGMDVFGLGNAVAANADGSVVTGFGAAGTVGAWWWTEGRGVRSIPGGAWSRPEAITPDGSVIVGTGTVNGEAAVMWSPRLRTVVDLNEYLPSLGINLSGWYLNEAKDVSADGSTIVGIGTYLGSQRAYIVTGVPAPGCGLILGVGALLVTRRRQRG